MSTHDRLVRDTDASRQRFLSIPIIQRALRGEVTRHEYVVFLSQAYQHVRQTVPLMMGMGYHLPERLRWMMPAVAEYIEEEIGHDAWILDDLTACGADAEHYRQAAPMHATEMMIAYAHDGIARGNPVSFLGMVFVLEGVSAALATRAAGALQTALGLPKTAFRYLASHGALDVQHVGFYERLVDRLTDDDDRAALIHAANRFYDLYGDIFRQIDAVTAQGDTP
ncbi:iron-containing redox enzyme family protein [Luteibacter sp. PPL201]|jgi:pyrroloquinoline quinone (PQQ) biosynthesis protein C|uniref:Iron-containing redox enzyme family protein n=1 Tax=Luteibacter sahnii TaxID=3021977 RepID=A0ABT6BEL5_9GAMM|nr:iron-containing redox enzyme family protein [Luteibacter sp. PPL193]MDY1549814.1 iron-containing redox enzyme family protein [Luteibacter sp. PPL193]